MCVGGSIVAAPTNNSITGKCFCRPNVKTVFDTDFAQNYDFFIDTCLSDAQFVVA